MKNEINNQQNVMNIYDYFAKIYEITCRDKKDDLPLYLSYAKKIQEELKIDSSQIRIIEIGCGTGRVGLFLVRNGFNVTGADISQNMLNIATKKLQEELDLQGKICFYKQDMCELDLPCQQFQLALIPFSAFGHIFQRNQQEEVLLRISQHLATNGRLIISMGNLNFYGPSQSRVGTGQHETMPIRYKGTFFDDEGGHIITKYDSKQYDISSQKINYNHIYKITDRKGCFIKWEINSFSLRHVFRYEMETLLEKAKFKLENIYGYYDQSEFKNSSKRMIFVARKKQMNNNV